jgi:hypothetical protein
MLWRILSPEEAISSSRARLQSLIWIHCLSEVHFHECFASFRLILNDLEKFKIKTGMSFYPNDMVVHEDKLYVQGIMRSL